MQKLTAISLFSGCGGFDFGAAQAGIHFLWANDIDPVAGSAYRSILPEVEFHVGDNRFVDVFTTFQRFCFYLVHWNRFIGTGIWLCIWKLSEAIGYHDRNVLSDSPRSFLFRNLILYHSVFLVASIYASTGMAASIG